MCHAGLVVLHENGGDGNIEEGVGLTDVSKMNLTPTALSQLRRESQCSCWTAL